MPPGGQGQTAERQAAETGPAAPYNTRNGGPVRSRPFHRPTGVPKMNHPATRRRHLPVRSFLAPLAAIALLAAAAPAPAQPPAPKKIAAVEGITEYQLDNGARVLLFPDPSSSTVTVNMTVLVGSRHEGYGETGMAHLLEHMVFKGTPTFANVPKALRDHGAASFNGSTWLDR